MPLILQAVHFALLLEFIMSRSRTGLLGPLLAALALASCASVPPVFPAAEVEALADRSIAAIRGLATPAPPQTLQPLQDAAELQLGTPSLEVDRLQIQMARRFADLGPLLDSGTVGLGADGYVAVRDGATISTEARSVVANENADRAALYREIAIANSKGQWSGEIRSVFATRWIALAKPGWWYQDANGSWKQR
jgi:uncharacterized protein YdbL (DUF1318 family)